MNGIRTASATERRADFATPERNNYFHGKMLDVYHFELETAYGILRQRRLNRLVLGTGVVCGLNVEAGDRDDEYLVSAGYAIDHWGREIVVPNQTRPCKVPHEVIDEARRNTDECDVPCIDVFICYRECTGSPAPMLAGDCLTAEPCAPGMISERYEITFAAGCARRRDPRCQQPDIVANGRIDQDALANWITNEPCRIPTANPCVLLANIPLVVEDNRCYCDPTSIDITVRPVVYTNRVLAELMLCLIAQVGRRREEDWGS
jgi:hypothetical protein